MKVLQNTYGIDVEFLKEVAKIAEVSIVGLDVKIQNTSFITCNGICFSSYRGRPFIGLRIPKNATTQEIGKLWLHELSHHRDNIRKKKLKASGLYVAGKKYGGEVKADKFADRMWARYSEHCLQNTFKREN